MNSVLRVNAARMDKINPPEPGETFSMFNLHDYKVRHLNINIMLYIYIYIYFIARHHINICALRFDILSVGALYQESQRSVESRRVRLIPAMPAQRPARPAGQPSSAKTVRASQAQPCQQPNFQASEFRRAQAGQSSIASPAQSPQPIQPPGPCQAINIYNPKHRLKNLF